ncbi:MAG: glycyl-radical enzyme activating protein [Clostridia bacterium]|nr:glycyl-radical enzyme activating protein [Clostridia bacterium]
MTGTILQYKRFAVHDGDGIRTTLFLKGCPLHCAWCHNPEGIAFPPQLAYLPHKCIGCGECAKVCPVGAHSFADGHSFDRDACTACGKCESACLGDALILYGRTVTAEEAAKTLCEDEAFFKSSDGGVTLSGGEPLMQPDFTAEVFRLVKERGISTALDTCGLAPRASLDRVLPFTDKVLFDVKAADSTVHERWTGRPNELILDNLRYINARGVPIEIRVPLIPGANDDQCDAIAALLKPLQSITAVRLLAYHPYAETKYGSLGLQYPAAGITPPTEEQMQKAADALAASGHKIIR